MDTQLNDVVARVMDIPVEMVQSDTGPRTLGAWTSLKHVQLIAVVEDSYEIRFSPKEIRSVRSVATLRALVQVKTGVFEGGEVN